MTDGDWAALFVEQSSSVMTYWTVYVLVVTLLVGFVAQKEGLHRIRRLLVPVFLVFAGFNGYPMIQAQMTLERIHDQLSPRVREIFTMVQPCWVALAHGVMDILVVAFLVGWGRWFGPRGMREGAPLAS